jgi:uncharacterized membrane protein YqjE
MRRSASEEEADMQEANILVMRRAAILWTGSALVTGFNIFAAYAQDQRLVMWALAMTAAFALFGVAFGVWAARKVTARP